MTSAIKFDNTAEAVVDGGTSIVVVVVQNSDRTFGVLNIISKTYQAVTVDLTIE
jgi:hypothetical protein